MSRQVSDALTAATYAQESGEVLVPILRLRHGDWLEPIYLVRDAKPLSHAGDAYQPFPFDLALPDDEDEGNPVLRWSAQNVSREIIGNFRGVKGAVLATVAWVLVSSPDVVEMGPFEVEISGIEYDAETISGVMTIEPILEEPFSSLEMTPGAAPGLF